MSTRSLSTPRVRQRRPDGAPEPTTAGAPNGLPDDRFFRHLVSSMRNGVIAIHRDGTLALMNDEAYRIFSLTRGATDVGRPLAEVFRDRPELLRVLSGAFEMTTLPNRAELRLKDLDRVIGYTLSQVRNDTVDAVGAVLFFKDLTQVEQLEERERLRDRLASLGEMAAGIAHELKNPLAGIEVMAGLLRRQVPDSPAAQSLLADIISEAKLANAIVVEMLEFVRPIRLQVERTNLADVLQQALMLAESKVPRGETEVAIEVPDGLPVIDGDASQLCQVFTNLLTNAFEALDGRGHITSARVAGGHRAGSGICRRRADPDAGRRDRRRRRRPGRAAGAERPDLQPVFHDQGDRLGPRAADRAEDRRRARWPHRLEQRAGPRHTFPHHAAGLVEHRAGSSREATTWAEF